MVLGTLFGALLVPGLYVLVRAGWRDARVEPPPSSEPVSEPEAPSAEVAS
jgi:hypothetical protein